MNYWPTENPQEKRNKLILFLISPFAALLYSLKSMNTRSSFLVFYGFAICFGMAFSIDAFEIFSTEAAGLDAGRYRLYFEEFSNMTTSEFFSSWNNYLSFEEGERDFYFTAMAFLVSRFTHNYHWFFMVLASVFAFFQLKSLKLLVEQKNWGNGLFFILLALFFTWNQIFNINAVRFYTAAWVCVYALLQIIQNKRKGYFLLLLITPFLHSSFWLIATVVVVAFLLKGFEWFWIVLFVISFFSSTFLADLLQRLADYLPDVYAKSVRLYTSDELLFSKTTFSGTGFWWIPMVFDRAYRIFTNLLVVLFIVNRKYIKNNNTNSLYLFIIIFMTFINSAMPIPALGTRSIVMAYPIIAYIWLANFGKNKYSWVINYAFPIVWLFQIIQYIGFYLKVLDGSFFISSPIILVIRYLLLA